MKIVVGTMSKRKCDVVEKVVKVFVKEQIEIVPFKADSLVPPTPWDKETFDGARNRALASHKEDTTAAYVIGIESGLVERYGVVYEEAWAVVIDTKGREYAGYSSGLKVPDYIITQMKKEDKTHAEFLHYLDTKEGRVNNDDTWGTYSGKLLIRDISLEEAVRNAFVQVFASKKSYYQK